MATNTSYSDNEEEDGEGTEANWSNVNGFYQTLSRLLNTITFHEFRSNTYEYWRSLRSLYSWTAPYFKDKPRLELDKKIREIKNHIEQYNKHTQNGAIKLAQEEYETAEELLYQTKILLVEQMRDANLLIGVREKGSDWY